MIHCCQWSGDTWLGSWLIWLRRGSHRCKIRVASLIYKQSVWLLNRQGWNWIEVCTFKTRVVKAKRYNSTSLMCISIKRLVFTMFSKWRSKITFSFFVSVVILFTQHGVVDKACQGVGKDRIHDNFVCSNENKILDQSCLQEEGHWRNAEERKIRDHRG